MKRVGAAAIARTRNNRVLAIGVGQRLLSADGLVRRAIPARSSTRSFRSRPPRPNPAGLGDHLPLRRLSLSGRAGL
jgi:hypothetical protein